MIQLTRRRWSVSAALYVIVFLPALSSAHAASLSSLAAQGRSVLPVPQQVMLGTTEFAVTNEWQLTLGPGISANDVACESLKEQLAARLHLTLSESKSTRPGNGIVRPALAPGAVSIGNATD